MLRQVLLPSAPEDRSRAPHYVVYEPEEASR